MHDWPTTPTSRRTTWKDYSEEILADFQKAHQDGKAKEELWRIAYLNGFKKLKDCVTHYTVQSHRVIPHKPQEIAIPKEGRASGYLNDLLAWHFDQDSRIYDFFANDIAPEDRIPLGHLLVDPLLYRFLEQANIDEHGLSSLISNADGFGMRREVKIRIPLLGEVGIKIRMNEVHASFELREGGGRWTSGNLIVDTGPLPETIYSAARGRNLEEVVSHDQLQKCSGIKILSIRRTKNPSVHMIVTDASHGDHMFHVPEKRKVAA